MNLAVTIFGRPLLLKGEWTPALRAHELRHAERQREVGPLKWLWMYLTDRRFRLQEEADAYRVSISHGDDLDSCAHYLSRWYLLGITIEEAKEVLKDG